MIHNDGSYPDNINSLDTGIDETNLEDNSSFNNNTMVDVANDWGDAQEVESNWFKFEKVGDKIKGTMLSKKLQPSRDPSFSDQWIYELQDTEGVSWNVGIAVTKVGTVARLNKCKLGEIIGILFESEGEAPKKGFHAVKNLKVFTFGMDPNYNELSGGEEVNEMPEM